MLARLGFKAGDDLLYGLAGYANGRISATYVDFENILASVADSENFGGARIGVGAEQAYARHHASRGPIVCQA